MKYSKNKLVDIGVSKLKNFGFVNVTKDNLFDDEVYKYYFKIFMNSIRVQNENAGRSIDELLSVMDKKNE
jgi:hypothetical protein